MSWRRCGKPPNLFVDHQLCWKDEHLDFPCHAVMNRCMDGFMEVDCQPKMLTFPSLMRMQRVNCIKLDMWVMVGTSTTRVVCHHHMCIPCQLAKQNRRKHHDKFPASLRQILNKEMLLARSVLLASYY